MSNSTGLYLLAGTYLAWNLASSIASTRSDLRLRAPLTFGSQDFFQSYIGLYLFGAGSFFPIFMYISVIVTFFEPFFQLLPSLLFTLDQSMIGAYLEGAGISFFF